LPLEIDNNIPVHLTSTKKISFFKESFKKPGFNFKPKGTMYTTDVDNSQRTTHHNIANSVMGTTHKKNEDGMFTTIINSFSSFNYI